MENEKRPKTILMQIVCKIEKTTTVTQLSIAVLIIIY